MAGTKGHSGRRPKPTAVLKLAGTYRADRRPANEMEPPVSIPEPPKSLKGEALEEWNRITALLAEAHCITELDRSALAAYCMEWARYVNANNKLRLGNTLLTESTKGTKMPHPLLRVSDRALSNMLRICTEFGFTPASRSRLNINTETNEDPLERLIRAQQERRNSGTATG